MSQPPELKPSDLIEITGTHPIPAVVTSGAFENAYEVVYVDDNGEVVAEEVQWADGAWRFLHLTPRRIPVEKNERFRPFVHLLQAKRKA